ncbi:MAG: TMEM175 family protein [Planctomycetota bacterium]
MTTKRLEAFSDGVLAIIITVMVFKIEAPQESSFQALSAVIKPIASFLLSFIYLGIYWNNHHHLMHLTGRVDGLVLWANLHLLFWLSLLPFGTHWLNQAGIASATVVVYGTILLGAGIAYRLLCSAILRLEPRDSPLSRAIGHDAKGYLSLALYVLALAVSMYEPIVSMVLYFIVSLIWVIPDSRIERAGSVIMEPSEPLDVE